MQPTPVKPSCKAAPITQVSRILRKSAIWVAGTGPTSGDEILAPNQSLLQGQVAVRKRPGMTVRRGVGLTADPTRFPSAPIKPLPLEQPMPSQKRKKPMSVLPKAAPPSEDWKDRKTVSLSTYADLSKSWKSQSMARTSLHLAGYFHELPGLTHPRQLASCSLRSASNAEFRWFCWACQLYPQEAQLVGFSP